MLNSQRIGSLPFLSIWDWSPFWVFAFLIAIDFGVIVIVMMGFVERRWNRGYYASFIFNDLLWIPLMGAMATLCMRHLDGHPHFYTQLWFHLAALGASLLLSVGLEVMAVNGKVFTLSQELSPSKLYHTVIFALMGYWIVTGAAAVIASALMTKCVGWPQIVWAIATVMFIFTVVVLDPRSVPNVDPTNPAHFDWSWNYWQITGNR